MMQLLFFKFNCHIKYKKIAVNNCYLLKNNLIVTPKIKHIGWGIYRSVIRVNA